jgi:hypothetical protein
MRYISGLKFMLLSGLFSAFPMFANAGDSQAALVRLHETVRVTGVILKGLSKPSPRSDLPAGEYSYVKLDYPIDFVDSDGTADGTTYRHQQKLGIGASKAVLAVSLGQNYGKHVVLVGHINASIDTTHFDAPFDLQFDVTEPIETVGQ